VRSLERSRNPRRTRLAAALVAGAVAVSTAACSTGKDAVVQGETFEFVSPDGKTEIHYDPASERKKVAPLSGPNLVEAGRTVDLQKDFAGKVVVLNLWGQWCGPCRSESDDLQRLHETYAPKGAEVLGIDLRDPNRSKPVDFVKDNGITYPSIWDPSQAAVAALHGFPTSVVPSTLVLDKQHRVAAVYLAEITDTRLAATIDTLLAEPDGGAAA